jgi:hypothetical protein
MSERTDFESAVDVPAGADPKARIKKLVRWAARITSIPALVLALISLLPALASFSISARDDKIIALGLCGVCIGIAAAWRWASVGGTIIMAVVITMLTQGDSLFYPDPFSVAFALQGILFLISGTLNSQPSKADSGMRWGRPAAIAFLGICLATGVVTILRGPGPVPVPKDKETFVGTWQNDKGLTIEISPEGHAKVTGDAESNRESQNPPATPKTAPEDFLVYFQADAKLELSRGPLTTSKVYHIDRYPHAEGKQVKMVLNASNPYNRSKGLVFVKKPVL